ncbi:MAG: hypothetical protein AAF351_07605 [Pseudomonadota bacterium]
MNGNRHPIGVLFAIFLLLATDQTLRADVQVILHSDRNEYLVGDPINLYYEATWLGRKDGNVSIRSTGFPSLEVKFFNESVVDVIVTGESELASKPSRHERFTLAPTMVRTSALLAINDKTRPVSFFDGTQGYFNLDRHGTYVIQASFSAEPAWRLHDDQENTIHSSVVIVHVGNTAVEQQSPILESIKTTFQSTNPEIRNVQILDSKPKHTEYWVVARGFIESNRFNGSFSDELFGVFVVDSSFSYVETVVDVFPTPRWRDYIVWISDYDMSSAVISGKGATYGDHAFERTYDDP